jgi:hypothetical protein
MCALRLVTPIMLEIDESSDGRYNGCADKKRTPAHLWRWGSLLGHGATVCPVNVCNLHSQVRFSNYKFVMDRRHHPARQLKMHPSGFQVWRIFTARKVARPAIEIVSAHQ